MLGAGEKELVVCVCVCVCTLVHRQGGECGNWVEELPIVIGM